MKVQFIMGQVGNVNKQKQSQISSKSTGYLSTISINKGDQVSFGISSGRSWKPLGNSVLKMCRSELEEMAEYFHKSSIDDIKGVCRSSSLFGAKDKQTNAFSRLYDAVNDAKSIKKNSSSTVKARMNERAKRVEDVYSKIDDDPEDFYWHDRANVL